MTEKLRLMALVLLGTAVGLLCAEVVVRLGFPSRTSVFRLHDYLESDRGKFARYDAVLGWDGLENAEDDFTWVDCRHHVKQNRFGYRSGDHDPGARTGRRVLVLGDSFVWGFGVEDDEIFTRVMEQSTAGRIEAVNMGVPGYGTDQEYLLWSRKGRPWLPDDVLLMVTLYNDFWDNVEAVRYSYPKPLFRLDAGGGLVLTNVPVPQRARGWREPDVSVIPIGDSWFYSLASRSAFADLALHAFLRNERIRNLLESHEIIPERKPVNDDGYSLFLAGPERQAEVAWQTLFGIIGSLSSDVAKSGARLTVAIIPSNIQVYPELWKRFAANAGPQVAAALDPEAPSRRLTRWCAEKGIGVVDLLPGLAAAGRSNIYLYFPKNRHWTADGHRVVANILLKELNIN